jgi:hypothetical protein
MDSIAIDFLKNKLNGIDRHLLSGTDLWISCIKHDAYEESIKEKEIVNQEDTAIKKIKYFVSFER